MSRIDFIYRRLTPANFYSKGWGSYEHLIKIVNYRRNYVGNREGCLNLVKNDYPVEIEKEYNFKDHTLLEGSFATPFSHLIPDLMPPEVQRAKFQFLIPKKSNYGSLKPVVLHFAGTGDHGFWRRRAFLAKPLMLKNSVASILIENPFYGARKPKDQNGSNLLYVKDLFTMGGCLVTESVVLMRWCEKNGYGPFVLTGLSMGGHMACLASTVWPKPLALVPCLNWTTAATVFTRGILSKANAWNQLEADYNSDGNYKKLKEQLKQRHIEDNLKRDKKKVCPFMPDSNIEFTKLTNYGFSWEKPINMEIVEFMHLLMDECTHLLNFDVPIDTDLVHVIAANDDAFVLRDGVNDFQSLWPGCHVEFIDKGHVSAFVLSLSTFRERIIETMEKMIQKHYGKESN